MFGIRAHLSKESSPGSIVHGLGRPFVSQNLTERMQIEMVKYDSFDTSAQLGYATHVRLNGEVPFATAVRSRF